MVFTISPEPTLMGSRPYESRPRICRIASSNPPAHLVDTGRQEMENMLFCHLAAGC